MEKKLPKNWVETKLDQVVLSKKGKKPKILKEVAFDGSVPYLDIKAFEKNEIRRYADVDSSNLINESEIGIVWDGARSGWVSKGKKGAVGSTITIIKPLNIASDFLYRFLQSKFDYLNTNTRGTGIPHVDPKVLWSINFPLPPLPEQQRIVAKLDELFGHLDTLKTRLENIPQILKNFRQAVLTQAVTGKLTEEWRKGKDLKEWEEVTLKDITNKIGSGSTPRGGSSSYKDEGIPLVRSMNIRFSGIKLKGLAFIDEDQADRLKNVVIEENDILLNITGASIGRVCLAEDSIVGGRVNQHVTIIRLNDDNLPQYVNMYLASSIIQNYIFNENYGVTRQALTKTQTQNLKIKLPPKEEQTEIVKRVEHLFSKADAIEAQYQSLKTKIDSLPQAILAKAFKGELVEQLPTDGDAKDLLEEIKRLKTSLRNTKQSLKGKKNK